MQTKTLYTLTFIRTESQVLLGWKKRGFGVNKWNGFGGKVEPNESILDAAAREVKEECGLTVKTSDLRDVGHLEYRYDNDQLVIDGRVFSTTIYEGLPIESEEMRPKWFYNDKIPYDEMWPDNPIWFPCLLKQQPFYAMFRYQGYDTILDYEIKEVESMEVFYAQNPDLPKT